MSEIVGYARVSSASQNLDTQIDALQKAGCQKIYSDRISGKTTKRPEWENLLTYIRSGDTLMITELSRMTRSLSDLLTITELLEKRRIHLHSVRENIDTSCATGRAFLSIMGAISQMELELRAERTKAGRESAKARGRMGGRPGLDKEKLEQARILYENSDKTAQEVCDNFGFSKRSLFKYIQNHQNSKNTNRH